MAWPPAPLPTNRTNATPQQDTHPADHNAANLAVNDTVGKVQQIEPLALRNMGSSYGQVGQQYNAGQQTPIVWAVRYYDSGAPAMATPGASLFTIPPGMSGTWALTCSARSEPGAPVGMCDLTLTTTPALTVIPAAYLPVSKRLVSLTWTGELPAGTQFSWTFYNGHSGLLTLVAQTEARWVAL